MILDSLFIYPVKSGQAVRLSQSAVEEEGLINDRRLMIIDANGKFITQRSHGKMTGISAHIDDHGISLGFGGETHNVSWSSARKDCEIWNDKVELAIAKKEVNQALSNFLGQSVELARMDDRSKRRTSGQWADAATSLSDGYPVLVTNTASLKDLEAKAGIPLSMTQFRPNVVIKSDRPWAEDGWREIQVGEVVIELVKPCTRCQITTLNPGNGYPEFPETMAAMIKHRRSADPRVKGVLFGWNGIVKKIGTMKTGDPVRILRDQAPWPTQ